VLPLIRRALPAALLVAAGAARAQELPEFNKLRTPSSPAFVILGVTPSQIERPNRPGAFAASFLQTVQDAAGRLPQSYAVELAPYWLRPRPGLTFAQYARGGPRSAYQDASISLAITDSLGGEAAPGGDARFRRLGVGFRTTLRPGRLAAGALLCADTVSRLATAVALEIGAAVAADPTVNRLRREGVSSPAKLDSAAAISRVIAAPILDRSQARLAERAKACSERLSAREGIVVDIAGAGAADFPGGRASAGELSKLGVWITPAWLGRSFSHVGVLRATFDGVRADTTVRLYDLGVRSVYAWQRFASSVEAVYRRVDRPAGDRNHARFSAIFDAKLTDETWLTLTAGRDFDHRAPNSLLGLIALKWQLGEQRVPPPAIRVP
jgi:hypothetical protein